MASTGFKNFISQAQQDISLSFIREQKLYDAPAEVQDWIRELQLENNRLKESNIKLHHKLGSTCFNPIQDE